MFNGDRTTKLLLTIIAIFLGVLVVKSFFENATPAVAQTASTTSASNGTVLGYRTVPISTIKLNDKEKILSVQIIDSAQSFIIQYANRLEVYRVDDVVLSDSNLKSSKR